MEKCEQCNVEKAERVSRLKYVCPSCKCDITATYIRWAQSIDPKWREGNKAPNSALTAPENEMLDK